ncbi:MAG TPA: hypothetical protein VGF67_28000 [Ktedonobacteraceae bacterium]|jgi:hypothetical protein
MQRHLDGQRFNMLLSGGTLVFVERQRQTVARWIQVVQPGALLADAERYYRDFLPQQLLDAISTASGMAVARYDHDDREAIFTHGFPRCLKSADVLAHIDEGFWVCECFALAVSLFLVASLDNLGFSDPLIVVLPKLLHSIHGRPWHNPQCPVGMRLCAPPRPGRQAEYIAVQYRSDSVWRPAASRVGTLCPYLH